MKIKRLLTIDSTMLTNAGYHAATQTLEVEYTSGHVYRFYDISQQLYNEFAWSESKGKFFGRFIQPKFKFTREN